MMSAAAIAAQRHQLLDAGWNPVPASPRTKACYVEGWPRIQTSGHHIENWRPTAWSNTALVTNTNYFAVDGDIRDQKLADRVMSSAFCHLGHTPFIRVGRAPKWLALYRKETPISVRTDGFKIAGCDGDGIEILSAKQDSRGVYGCNFNAFGIHPGTGKPYAWVDGACPLEDTILDAPLGTQEQVDAFLAEVRSYAPAALGRNGNPNTDTQRAYNTDGKVTDGRETLLRDCVYQAACEIKRAGRVLHDHGIAGDGWELFKERAAHLYNKNGTSKSWTYEDALSKARSTLRRIRDGIVTFTDPAFPRAIFYHHADKIMSPVEHGRPMLCADFVAWNNLECLEPERLNA